jgi:hypothetical protein
LYFYLGFRASGRQFEHNLAAGVNIIRLFFAYNGAWPRMIVTGYTCPSWTGTAGTVNSLKPTFRRRCRSAYASPLPDKIIELVERGGGLRDQESRLMLEQGIATGRGGVFLNLTYEQYTRLKSR